MVGVAVTEFAFGALFVAAGIALYYYKVHKAKEKSTALILVSILLELSGLGLVLLGIINLILAYFTIGSVEVTQIS